jgi:hypothetical protein
MECEEFKRLEQSFVDVRLRRLEHLANATLTLDLEDKLSRAELQALIGLLDHRAAHGCQSASRRTGGSETAEGMADKSGVDRSKLPASRSLGGIIGPY